MGARSPHAIGEEVRDTLRRQGSPCGALLVEPTQRRVASMHLPKFSALVDEVGEPEQPPADHGVNVQGF
jgi:hypothetical protein